MLDLKCHREDFISLCFGVIKQSDKKFWRMKFRRNWRLMFVVNLIFSSNISGRDKSARMGFSTHSLVVASFYPTMLLKNNNKVGGPCFFSFSYF